MNYDFKPGAEQIHIPLNAYKPVKKCPHCNSVYITDTSCESCGRSMLYHPIGKPFGAKSFYGLKERYIESFNGFLRFFPQFENKQSKEANSYVRHLSKRFTDLVSAFNTDGMIEKEDRKFFYVESTEIINELLRYGLSIECISLLLDENDSSFIGKELNQYLVTSASQVKKELSWQDRFLQYRVLGIVKSDFVLKAFIITASVLTLAVKYKEFITSQFGK